MNTVSILGLGCLFAAGLIWSYLLGFDKGKISARFEVHKHYWKVLEVKHIDVVPLWTKLLPNSPIPVPEPGTQILMHCECGDFKISTLCGQWDAPAAMTVKRIEEIEELRRIAQR